MIIENFEKNLVECLQPIRGFALASSLYHFFETGVYDYISENQCDSLEIANSLDIDRYKLEGFLKFLSNEGYIEIKNKIIALTKKGELIAPYRPWYTMMIGGYGKTFLQMGGALKKLKDSCERDVVRVGVGSCGISEFDAFPLTKKLIGFMRDAPKTICDLGCGNGMYLVNFCKKFNWIRSIGIEPNQESCDEAMAYIEKAGYSDKVSIVCEDAISFLQGDNSKSIDLYILGFVLHEVLGQSGEKGVVQMLNLIKQSNPDAYIAIIEVDDQIQNDQIMTHGLAAAYYNSYYLLHYFTNQKLATRNYWEDLFRRNGFEIITAQTTDYYVDSTELEVGYLIKSCSV